jgi:hypothetical protein
MQQFYRVTRMHKATRTYSSMVVQALNAKSAVQMSKSRFPNDVKHAAVRLMGRV